MTRDARVAYGSCPICGYVMLPVLPLSPCGHGEPADLVELTDPGVVYSWTIVVGPSGEDTVMVMADFLRGRLRLTSPLAGSDRVAIGDEVVVENGNDTPFVLRLI